MGKKRKEPIIRFNSKRDIEKCLKYWRKKLFLDDWVIHWRFVDFDHNPLNGKDLGQCECDYINKAAVITLATHDTVPGECIMFLCDEKVMVHELLHLKYPSYTNSSYESYALELNDHQRMEELAKSLIMVKYNLPFQWFDREYHTKKVEHRIKKGDL